VRKSSDCLWTFALHDAPCLAQIHIDEDPGHVPKERTQALLRVRPLVKRRRGCESPPLHFPDVQPKSVKPRVPWREDATRTRRFDHQHCTPAAILPSSLDPLQSLPFVHDVTGRVLHLHLNYTPLQGPVSSFEHKNHASRAQRKLSLWYCCFHSPVEHTGTIPALYVHYLPQGGWYRWIN